MWLLKRCKCEVGNYLCPDEVLRLMFLFMYVGGSGNMKREDRNCRSSARSRFMLTSKNFATSHTVSLVRRTTRPSSQLCSTSRQRPRSTRVYRLRDMATGLRNRLKSITFTSFSFYELHFLTAYYIVQMLRVVNLSFCFLYIWCL